MDRIGKLGAVLSVSLFALPFGCSSILGIDNDYVRGEGGAGGEGLASSSAAQASGPGSTGSSSGNGSGPGGGSGSGSGSGVGGGSGIIYQWEAVDPGPPANPCTSTYTYTLPAWLAFSSPTPTERTSQVAVDKLCRGYTQGVPRARNAGAGWGLSVEAERTNLIINSDSWGGGTGWSQGNMAVQTGFSDPAGGVDAIEFFSPASISGSYSNYSYPSASGQVASAWLRGSVGDAPFAHFRHAIEQSWVDVTSSAWRRYAVSHNFNSLGEIALETRDKPTGAGAIMAERKIHAFAPQLEASARYPSSYIPTGAGSVTRQAERLMSAPGALGDLAPGGYFKVFLTFAPHFASNEVSANEYDLLFFEEKARIYLRNQRLVMLLDGQKVESNPVVFSREQALTIAAYSIPGAGFGFSITGTTGTDGKWITDSGPPLNIGPDAAVFILSGPEGADEGADLRAVSFSPPTEP